MGELLTLSITLSLGRAVHRRFYMGINLRPISFVSMTGEQRTLPGFNRFKGSTARHQRTFRRPYPLAWDDSLVRLTVSIRFTVPLPSSVSRYSTFPNPTPCSPVHVPSRRIARSTISCTATRILASSSSSVNSAREWTLPSPT